MVARGTVNWRRVVGGGKRTGSIGGVALSMARGGGVLCRWQEVRINRGSC